MHKSNRFSTLLNAVLLAICVVMFALIIRMSFATNVNGKWMVNTPMPTSTPEKFPVILEIVSFDKNVSRMCCIDVLWIVRVVRSDRSLPQKKYFLGLRNSSKLELKRGMKIQLMCTGTSWLNDVELSCEQDYKIIP